MIRTVLPVLLLLSGCVAIGSPEPVSARLSSEGLRVTFSDGRVCRGGQPPEGVRRWRGPLSNCPEGWRYFVELEDRTNPARFIVETVLTALTLEDALAPAAELTVVDPAGQATVFVSPPPARD